MPKQRNSSAKQKLKQEPFRTPSEKKEFVEKIRREVLGRLEIARAMEEFTAQKEYQFFKQKFEKGMFYRYSNENIDEIVHVSINDSGIQVIISERAKEIENQNELNLIGQLAKGMSDSFVVSYFEAMGYLPKDTVWPKMGQDWPSKND